MIIYFFGNKDCEICNKVLREINEQEIGELCKIKFIDAFDDKKQELCDEMGVDELPHVILLKDDSIVFEEIGHFNVKLLKEKILKENKK